MTTTWTARDTLAILVFAVAALAVALDVQIGGSFGPSLAAALRYTTAALAVYGLIALTRAQKQDKFLL